MQLKDLRVRPVVAALASLLAFPTAAYAATVANPLCPDNTALFDPDSGQDINVPAGFKVSVFAKDLNFPTGIAFLGNAQHFEVYVLESGHGLPSPNCNDQSAPSLGGDFDANNPFTPDILVFDETGNLLRKLAKPTGSGTVQTGGLQSEGPSVDIGFSNGFQGGTLFATDSNQATHGTGQNNSSRIVTVDPQSGKVTPFITGLPTGDHPTEQLAFKSGWIYWSQGSTTNSGVVGLDNNGGKNQPDIPCQDIVLSNNVFDSGGGVFTSGYMPFGKTNPGGTIKAFTNTQTSVVRQGVCDGAILRAQLNNPNNIQAFSWGYRNGYAIRFAPENHPLHGQMLVGEDGPDERGARPSNGAPDNLHIARQNPDGTPDYHGWPDRFGFLPSSQAVFNPIGGPSDDLCVFDPANPPSKCTVASLALILSEDVPIRDVLAFPPQAITSPLAIEAADSSFTGLDFVPNSFVGGPVQNGAVLYALEGDFGFSPPNASDTCDSHSPPLPGCAAPEVGHEIRLLNFVGSQGNQMPALQIQNFARNTTGDQAFITGARGFNRPTNIRFGPDGCAYIADYGAVRDVGADTHFVGPPANGPLLQIPGTGVIWKICKE
ncbi:MAG: hypothetical protein E6H78_08995 [Betaproteobacteria bacterium]|nr:MAG: hypothetical protein E6H78_08995 [Betaproteobacteria bacterium]